MTDHTLRELERQLKQNPDDKEIVAKMANARARAGLEVEVRYYISDSKGKFLSNNHTFTKAGKAFKSRAEAVRFVERLIKHQQNNIKAYRRFIDQEYYGKATTQCENIIKALNKANIITIQTFSIEVECEPLDIETEMQRAELEDLKKQRQQLEAKEKAILAKTEKLEKALKKTQND